MPEIAGPDPVVPLFSGVHTLDHRSLFFLCLGLTLRGCVVGTALLVGLWLYTVWAALPEFSWGAFLYTARYCAGSAWILLMPACFPLLAYWKARRQKAVGVPVLYAFDAKGTFSSCAIYESRVLWEYYTGRREVKDFFILNDGVRQNIWPKAAFSAEGVAKFRELLREISPKGSKPVEK